MGNELRNPNSRCAVPFGFQHLCLFTTLATQAQQIVVSYVRYVALYGFWKVYHPIHLKLSFWLHLDDEEAVRSAAGGIHLSCKQ